MLPIERRQRIADAAIAATQMADIGMTEEMEVLATTALSAQT